VERREVCGGGTRGYYSTSRSKKKSRQTKSYQSAKDPYLGIRLKVQGRGKEMDKGVLESSCSVVQKAKFEATLTGRRGSDLSTTTKRGNKIGQNRIL